MKTWQSPIDSSDLSVSFEFFPPKTHALEGDLWGAISRLAPLNPKFVSVTYGAGGTTRTRTHALVKRIREETDLNPAAHLTCVGASKAEIDEIADGYWQAGVRHIVALRGDPPQGETHYTPHPDGYAYANDLVEGLRKRHDFEISVGTYPESHPESKSLQDDIDALKRKVDAGATRAITQYFFDVNHYLDFLDKVEKANIKVEMVPGILPIGNYKQMVRFSKMCGTEVPNWIHALFADLQDHPDLQLPIAIHVAAEQCKLLVKSGITNLHFYTLNRARLVLPICRLLGIK